MVRPCPFCADPRCSSAAPQCVTSRAYLADQAVRDSRAKLDRAVEVLKNPPVHALDRESMGSLVADVAIAAGLLSKAMRAKQATDNAARKGVTRGR